MDEHRSGDPLTSDVMIRTLSRDDLSRIVAMDEQHGGRRRLQYLEGKLARALDESSVRISLGAEIDGMLVGTLMGEMQYGEFGVPEPVAVIDTVLVDHDFRRRGIGLAMFEQLEKNLAALRVRAIRTEVAWNELDLLGWFKRAGFEPVPRIVLEKVIDAA